MRVLSADERSIAEAAELIRAGELVAFPTETVYGLGADARDARACAAIFQAKRRPFFDPLIVHVAQAEQAAELGEVSALARRLIAAFWPGPLTLVLPRTPVVPDLVTAGLPTVAVRMPAHEVALRLIRAAGTPLAAPSANRFGLLSPTTAAHVREQLSEDVPLVLDGGSCPVGVESTILDLTNPRPTVLRPGGVEVEALHAVIGELSLDASPRERPHAPGQFKGHYAPRTPLRFWNGQEETTDAGLLAFERVEPGVRFAAVEVLTSRGDLREAAGNLFAALHRLDAAGLRVIYAQRPPERGLGLAILDRLRKAERATHGTDRSP